MGALSPVRERRGRWRRRETEWPEEDLALPPWQQETSPPCPLFMNGEGEICFGIWRAVRGSARVLAQAGNKPWPTKKLNPKRFLFFLW